MAERLKVILREVKQVARETVVFSAAFGLLAATMAQKSKESPFPRIPQTGSQLRKRQDTEEAGSGDKKATKTKEKQTQKNK